MQHIYIRMRHLLATVFFSAAALGVQSQVYVAANMSGAKEEPPNASSGTGMGMVIISGNMMQVKASFSGLTGNTTVAHIHGPTAVAGTGTAGVATVTPSFTSWPAGVTSGTYDRSFDMTMASSYNSSFITANGGTPATAFAALKAALDEGKAYLNIHSTFAPGGEIRAFFTPCSPISVSIPDAFALPAGVAANTVYPAYAPASSLTLSASVSGGTEPYAYKWSNGATTATLTVSPLTATTYSVSVTDANGCPGNPAQKTVEVADIASGKNGDKIDICHRGNRTLSISATDVGNHLNHGDILGSCAVVPAAVVSRQQKAATESSDQLSVQVLQNPSPNYFDIRISSKVATRVAVNVFDFSGRAVDTRSAVMPNSTLRIGAGYSPGTYVVEVTQGTERKLLKLMKGL